MELLRSLCFPPHSCFARRTCQQHFFSFTKVVVKLPAKSALFCSFRTISWPRFSPSLSHLSAGTASRLFVAETFVLTVELHPVSFWQPLQLSTWRGPSTVDIGRRSRCLFHVFGFSENYFQIRRRCPPARTAFFSHYSAPHIEKVVFYLFFFVPIRQAPLLCWDNRLYEHSRPYQFEVASPKTPVAALRTITYSLLLCWVARHHCVRNITVSKIIVCRHASWTWLEFSELDRVLYQTFVELTVRAS